MPDTKKATNNNEGNEQNAAEVLTNLESMIKSHIAGLDKRKKERKNYKEMLASTLMNDEVYKNHDLLAKDAAKLKSRTKSEIIKRPENYEVNEKIKNLNIEIKEMDTALSEYLREYERLSGSNEIQDSDGEEYEIVYVAKLVKKSSKL